MEDDMTAVYNTHPQEKPTFFKNTSNRKYYFAMFDRQIKSDQINGRRPSWHQDLTTSFKYALTYKSCRLRFTEKKMAKTGVFLDVWNSGESNILRTQATQNVALMDVSRQK
jgi:hypothetical protein